MNTDDIHKPVAPLGAKRQYPQKARARSEYRIACAAAARTRWAANTWKERFWKSVDKKGIDECWPFIGHDFTKRGYGRFHMQNKRYGAHRIAYELSCGEIPEGFNVCHHCDNPPCCNPKHLFAGTSKDNTNDMMQKGRHRHVGLGESHPNHKLTESNVRDVLYIFNKGGISSGAIARFFGVNPVTIDAITSWKTWTHVAPSENSDQVYDAVRKSIIPPAFPDRRGELATNSIITNAQAGKIRKAYATGNYTYLSLAEIYGVCKSTIGEIVRGNHFKHV